MGQGPGHVFISYVHEDAERVDRLQRILQAAEIRVWRDTADLWPGQDWRHIIQRAITDDALVFLACFSQAGLRRRKTFQNEELNLAIDQLRLRRTGEPWLIPIRFDECEIPDNYLGGGRTLASIQRADLFGDTYEAAVKRLTDSILRILGQGSQPEPHVPRTSATDVAASSPAHGGDRVREPSRTPSGTLTRAGYWPSSYLDTFHRHSPPPDVLVRLACSQPLQARSARLSLGGDAFYAINNAIGTRDVGVGTLLGREAGGRPILHLLDEKTFTSKFMRIVMGHHVSGGAMRPDRSVECTFVLDGSGADTNLTICADALFWILTDPKMRVPAEDIIMAAHVLAQLLILRLIPAAVASLTGAEPSAPAMELLIEARSVRTADGAEMATSISDLVILDQFGLPRAGRSVERGNERLPPDLIDTNDMGGAVRQALRYIIMDWGCPDPKIA